MFSDSKLRMSVPDKQTPSAGVPENVATLFVEVLIRKGPLEQSTIWATIFVSAALVRLDPQAARLFRSRQDVCSAT